MFLTWLFIGLFGVLFAAAWRASFPQFMCLSAMAASFLLATQLTSLPMSTHVLFWIIWSAALGVAYAKAEISTPVAAGACALSAAIVLLGVALSPAPSAQPTLALNLPGGGVQRVVVQASLPAAQIPEPAQCSPASKTARFYAYDAEPGTHNFGAAITVDTVEAGAQRFATKAYCDAIWLAATVEYIKHGRELDQATAQAQAQVYLSDRTKLAAALQFVYDQIDSFQLINAGNVKYASLGMIPGANPGVVPTLTKFSVQPALGQTLVVKLKNGQTRNFRIVCDLQPAELEFPKVSPPVTPEVPPKTPPTKITPPPPTTSTTPPVTTTTTTPVTTTTPPSSTTTTPPVTTSTTSTTTTTPSTSTTTSTTTTPPVTTTTVTTPPKGPVPLPSGGLPPATTTGSTETIPPVEPTVAHPTGKPGDEVTTVPAPGATQEPSQPKPTPLPTVAPTSGTSIPDPDLVAYTTTDSPQWMNLVVLLALLALAGGFFRQSRRS